MIGFKSDPVASEFSRLCAAMRAARLAECERADERAERRAQSEEGDEDDKQRKRQQGKSAVDDDETGEESEDEKKRAKRRAKAAEDDEDDEKKPAKRETVDAAASFAERFALAGARRRGLVDCAPPPRQPEPVYMSAEAIINAGKKRRGEIV